MGPKEIDQQIAATDCRGIRFKLEIYLPGPVQDHKWSTVWEITRAMELSGRQICIGDFEYIRNCEGNIIGKWEVTELAPAV